MTLFDKKASSSAESADWPSEEGGAPPRRRQKHTTGLRARGVAGARASASGSATPEAEPSVPGGAMPDGGGSGARPAVRAEDAARAADMALNASSGVAEVELPTPAVALAGLGAEAPVAARPPPRPVAPRAKLPSREAMPKATLMSSGPVSVEPESVEALSAPPSDIAAGDGVPSTERVPESEPAQALNEEWLRTIPITDEGQLDDAARAVEQAARLAEQRAAAAKFGDGVAAVSAASGTLAPAADVDLAPHAGVDVDDFISDEDTHVGTTIDDRYEVDDILGEGGMGRVYLARHIKIGKKVAIKVLHAELAKDKEAVSRFVREARSASSIGNAHIVDISDFGELHDGSTFFVMEYLEGPTLADMIEKAGAMEVDLVCDIAQQLCEGLGAAHAQQIVHRDLKPENITLVERAGRENFCKILDFGIAKVSGTSSTTKLTMAGAVFGTPHYMSPEQAAGASVDHRTDIYSLGVMLYEMVTGELPFQADNFMGILTQHMYKAPVPIRSLVSAPDCPPGMEAIILKCLTKKPDGRYDDMAEVAADLRKFQQSGMSDAVEDMMARSGSFNVPADYFNSGADVIAAANATAQHQAVSPKRNTGLIVAVGVGLLGLIGVAAYFVLAGEPEPKIAQPTAVPSVTNVAAPTPQPTVTATATAAPVAEPKTISVLVYANPPSATAVLNGKPITLPETFDIKEGAKLKLLIKAPGYQPQTISVDDSKAKVLVSLKRRYAGPSVKHPPRPTTSGGTGKDVVDPWAPKN